MESKKSGSARTWLMILITIAVCFMVHPWWAQVAIAIVILDVSNVLPGLAFPRRKPKAA